MKYFFIFALLVGSFGANSLKFNEKSDPRFVDGLVVDAINSLRNLIIENGFDPLVINREAGEFSLPVPEIFSAYGYVENILVVGLSNIQVNSINFSLLFFRLDYDLELPGINISIGRAYGEVSGFGEKGDGTVAGNVDIGAIRVVGHAVIQISILSGISLSELAIDLTLANIDSKLDTVEIFNRDLTDLVNNFLSVTLPGLIDDFRTDINFVLEFFLKDIIERLLDDILG